MRTQNMAGLMVAAFLLAVPTGFAQTVPAATTTPPPASTTAPAPAPASASASASSPAPTEPSPSASAAPTAVAPTTQPTTTTSPATATPMPAPAATTVAAPPLPPPLPAPVPRAAASDEGAGSVYVIGPGDVLDVFVWRNPELSTSVPVRPDGKISSPLVGDVVATGKTSAQLAHEIETALAVYIRSPQVNVIVRNALSASSQVRVVGQAVNPKAIPYRSGLTVLDVVIAVGGLGEFAAGNRAKIVRPLPGGKSREIKVRLKRLLESGDMAENYPMEPGDVLVIPESFF